jgi:mono/diheme cytochrome c family protein
MAMRRRRQPAITVGEVMVWLLFFALLIPAGLVGWAIGHSESGTKTITVGAATTSTSTPTTTAAATTTTSAAGASGKAVFLASGCGACHTFKPAGSHGTIGPDLDTKPEADAKKAHMPLVAFVRESIVKPGAYISTGYPNVMPKNFGTKLTKAQLDALVSFIAGK